MIFLSIFIVVAAFAIWALVHSLLAAQPVKDWSERVFGPGAGRWYRLAYNAFAFISLLPLLPLLALLPEQPLYAVPDPWRWLFRMMQLAGAVLFMVALWQTDLPEFIGLRQISNGDGKPLPLRVNGLQAWVRHPLYTTALIALWFAPVMTIASLVTYLLVTIYFYVGSIHEEQRLLAEFGEPYRTYQQTTPRLVPCPRRPPQPRLPASDNSTSART